MARALVVALAVALRAPSVATADPMAGIVGSTDLALFDSANPAGLTNRPILGLQTDSEKAVGLDMRPATGQLVLVTVPAGSVSNAMLRTYIVDPATATATFVGSVPGVVPGAADTPTGIDVQPLVDRIRVVNAGNENFRINPNNGSLAGDDVNLTYTAPATGPITAVAYDRNAAPGPPLCGAHFRRRLPRQPPIRPADPPPSRGPVHALCPHSLRRWYRPALVAVDRRHHRAAGCGRLHR